MEYTAGLHRSFRINVSLALIPVSPDFNGTSVTYGKITDDILIASIFCLILLFQPDASQLTGFAVPAD